MFSQVQCLLNGFEEAFKGSKGRGDGIMFVFQKDQKKDKYPVTFELVSKMVREELEDKA